MNRPAFPLIKTEQTDLKKKTFFFGGGDEMLRKEKTQQKARQTHLGSG